MDVDPSSGRPLTRRRFVGATGCCGIAAALGVFRLPQAIAAPAARSAWDDEVRAFWQRVWQGLAAHEVADVHVHLLGHTGDAPDDAGAWIHPRTLQPWSFGDWVRRWAIERAAGVAGRRDTLTAAYVERIASLWADFPAGARPLALAFDAAHDERGALQRDHTMFCTGNGHAAAVARTHGWGWIASVHPDRPDAVDRLQAAAEAGASAVKWLPSAMAIDPAARRHARYYAELVRLKLPLLTHAGEEVAVKGAERPAWDNPLLLRHPAGEGVRVIVAHCATLGHAIDLDDKARRPARAFALFARLMDERAFGDRFCGDVSAVTQINRATDDLHLLLARTDWHARLLYGSDYPLPGLTWLTSVSRLADAGLLADADVSPLQRLQSLNPLAFDFALKRCLQSGGRRFGAAVFETRATLRGR